MSPFRTSNQVSSYWAGFIQTDGSLRTRSGKLPCRLTLQIKKDDRQHLEKFCEFIGFKNSIQYVDNHGFGAWRIDIYNAEAHLEALSETFRVGPDKADVFSEPSLSPTDRWAFLVGMIDGDGSVIWKNDSVKAVQVFGSLEMILWVRRTIDEKFPPLVPKRIKSAATPLKNGYITRLEGKRARDLVSFVNQLDLPKLDRKWDPFREDHRHAHAA